MTAPSPELRTLPSIERLAASLPQVPHAVAVTAAREVIELERSRLLAGEQALPARELEWRVRERAHELAAPKLRRVLNATGVIVHTNLGRAPLAAEALAAVTRTAGGYSNLEYDLDAGERGSRQAHVEELLCRLTGAEAALAVGNCAGAVLLGAAALAAGRDLVVSRGELIEIGGSFRIPDVVAQSGARLVEVGTTNRTRAEDYRRVLGPETGAVLRAHPSNFRTVGFVEAVEIEELCELAGEIPVIDDIGSGALADGIPELADEPPVRRSVAAGAALVCFSGDKLLGGPQAGLIVGRAGAVERARTHPLARAVRIDKLSLAALAATLALYERGDAVREIPVLRMLVAGESELAGRAGRIHRQLTAAGVSAHITSGAARVGGGALPLLELDGPVCAVDPGGVGADSLARRLRRGEPPVVGRLRDGWLILDPRTLTDDEADPVAAAVVTALAAS